jgi:hypothetical protein
MGFGLNWVDDPEHEAPILREMDNGFVSNNAWVLWILGEFESQGVADLTEQPDAPPLPVDERYFRVLDVDPATCTYPINVEPLTWHGTKVVTARACQAFHQRLSREPLFQTDKVDWWPGLWYWFYDFLAGAIEHGGFEVG